MLTQLWDGLNLCPDLVGFWKHGPRYWRVMRRIDRRAYQRSKP